MHVTKIDLALIQNRFVETTTATATTIVFLNDAKKHQTVSAKLNVSLNRSSAVSMVDAFVATLVRVAVQMAWAAAFRQTCAKCYRLNVEI